jgi:hypothetical protein
MDLYEELGLSRVTVRLLRPNIKYPYFVSRSIITRIKSKTTSVINFIKDGNLTIKSIIIYS